jgi:hypothetical protein
VTFTAKESADRDTFMAHRAEILGDEKNSHKTILFGEHLAGYILSHPRFRVKNMMPPLNFP